MKKTTAPANEEAQPEQPEQPGTETAIVPFIAEEAHFPTQADAPAIRRPAGNPTLLQWFNGLPAGRQLAVGWHIQCSKCSEKVAAALAGLGIPRLTVQHKMTGEKVEYWSLGSARLYVLCNGFGDAYEMRTLPDARDGIAYGWIAEKNHSKLKARVLVGELVEAGCTEIFVVTLEGMITDLFLQALAEQFRVLDAFERYSGGTRTAPFWGFALEMTPAGEPKMVGNNGKQSPIIPILARVPAGQIDPDYLRAHLIPRAAAELIHAQGLVSKAVQWSVETSARISKGQDREAWEEDPGYAEAMTRGNGKAARFVEEEDDDGEGQTTVQEALPASKAQLTSLANLARLLGVEITSLSHNGVALSYEEASRLIKQLSAEYNDAKRKVSK